MKAAVHRALWVTFLSRRFHDSPENVRKNVLREPTTGPTAQLPVLQVLKDNREDIPDVLLGVALWNLLPAYQETSLGMQKPVYEGLINTVYKRKVEELLRVSQEVQIPVFPGDPQQLIQEPLLTQEENLNASVLRLEVLLNGSLEQMSPDPVYPEFWTLRRNPFWSKVEDWPKGAKYRATIDARIQLPDLVPGIPVKMTVDISKGEFEGRTDFTIEPNGQMKVCGGYLSIKKEAGRPGLIRVSVQRTVRFSPDLDQFRVPTALYWMYSDLICAVHERLVEIGKKAPLKPHPSAGGKGKKKGLKNTAVQTPNKI